jgi:hypothetical protein
VASTEHACDFIKLYSKGCLPSLDGMIKMPPHLFEVLERVVLFELIIPRLGRRRV